MDLMPAGNEFQSLGVATSKERNPAEISLYRGSTSKCCTDDRRVGGMLIYNLLQKSSLEIIVACTMVLAVS